MQTSATDKTKPAEMSNISVIMCTLNEEKNLLDLLPKMPKNLHELVVVDGCSTDNTVATVKQLFPEAKVLLRQPEGRGDALSYGAKLATGDYLLFLDADGSQQPEEIPLYLQAINEGYDMVKGSRFIAGGRSEDETWLRRAIIVIAQKVANLLCRTKLTDTPYGLCLIERNKFLSLNITARSFDFEWELAASAQRKGLRIAEVPAVELKRTYGRSRLCIWRHGIVIALAVFREFFKCLLEQKRPGAGGNG